MKLNGFNRSMLKPAALTVIIAVVAVGMLAGTAVAEEEYTLGILATTDLHQYIVPYDYMNDTEVDDYGFSKTYTLIEEAREKYENTVLLDAGDAIQGSLIGVHESQVEPLEEGETQAIIKAMNAAGYDAAAIGNHEVQDYGLWFLDLAIEGSDFPWLTANMMLAEDPDQSYTEPYTILEREVGGELLEIGVISFVPPQIMDWGAAHLRGEVVAKDIIPQAMTYLPELEAKTDIVIINAHTGIDDSPLGSYAARENAGYYLAQLEGVDAMITGHQHEVFPGEAYEDMAGVDLDERTIYGVPTVMPGSWGRNLGIIELNLVHDDGEWDVVGHDVRNEPVDETVESHPMIEDIAADIHEKTVEYVRTPLGETERDITSYFARVIDSAVTQIVNEAQLWYAEAHFEGSEYEDYPLLSAAAPFVAGREGPSYFTSVTEGITVGDVTDIYLYDNQVRAMKLDGEQVIDWLESSVSRNFETIDPDCDDEQHLINYGEPAFNYDVIEGIEYEIDVTRPDDEKVISAYYEGEEVTADDTFIVITNDYRAGGGGDFPHMVEENIILDTADVNREQIIHYVQEMGTVNPEPSFNWGITPVEAEGTVLYRSHPDAVDYVEKYDIPGIEKLEVDEDGWGIYEIRLDELPR